MEGPGMKLGDFELTWLNTNQTRLSVRYTGTDIPVHNGEPDPGMLEWPTDNAIEEVVGREVGFVDRGDDLLEGIYHARSNAEDIMDKMRDGFSEHSGSSEASYVGQLIHDIDYNERCDKSELDEDSLDLLDSSLNELEHAARVARAYLAELRARRE